MGERSQKAVRMRDDKSVKDRTASSFGFEWTKFNDMFDSYEENFLNYISPLDKSFFKGKTVVDAGCGAGRHTILMAKYGATVVAFDLSKGAAEAARGNTAYVPTVSVAQADICSLPETWSDKFDAVVCIGVLHHLPDPQKGFRELVKLLKTGGTIAIWVYGTEDNNLARFLYDPVRRITSRLPHTLLYTLTLPVAVAVDACNKLRLPLLQHYAKFPFKTKWNDAFDVFSAPLVKYLSTAEIGNWFSEAGLHDIRVEHRYLGKTKKGIKGQGVK